MEAASYFWLGFGSAVGTLIVHKLWCKVAFGTGTVRGQPFADAPGRMAKLSWGETHYVIHGAGGKMEFTPGRKLIVLVHGFAGSAAVWKTARYLEVLEAAGYDVLIYDNWGHGFTDGPDIGYSAELFAGQLAELLLHLDVRGEFDLLGFSMGGAIATVFTHRFGSRVGKLVLQAPSIARDNFFPARAGIRLLNCMPFLRELMALLIFPHFGEGANSNNSAVVRAAYRLTHTMMYGSWCVGPTHQEDMFKDIVASGKEIMFMWGNKDTAVSIVCAPRLLEIAGDVPFVEGQGADHMTFSELGTDLGAEVGGKFRRALVAFLEGREVEDRRGKGAVVLEEDVK
ncbi:hypothetical protein TeGR_g5560, partial [Tetraparma gracilis]